MQTLKIIESNSQCSKLISQMSFPSEAPTEQGNRTHSLTKPRSKGQGPKSIRGKIDPGMVEGLVILILSFFLEY